MRKFPVPYTIQRNRVYYLNLRWRKRFIRWSLATEDPLIALQKVHQVKSWLTDQSLTEDDLRAKVSAITSIGPSKRIRVCDPNQTKESHERLSELFSLYEQEQMIENWGPRTASQNRATFNLLVEMIGDKSIQAVAKSDVRHFKQMLLSYPANRNKGSRKNKKVKQLIEEGCPAITLETVRNTMGRVSSFFNWLERQGYRNDNPFSGAAPRRVHAARSERQSFTDDDLRAIFGTPIFTEKTYLYEWQYWLPILGLATGARLEELCQLRGLDVKPHDDGYYLDINPQSHDLNKIKTSSAIRRIPLHRIVIDHGFTGLIEHCPPDRLIFDLRRVNTNLGHLPSKWFGRYKASLGLPKRTKVFHSFRHTLRDKLTMSGAPAEHIREILGHEQLGETFGRYGSCIPVSVLSKSINDVNLEEIFSD